MGKKIATGLAIITAILYVALIYRMLFVGFGRENVLLSEDMQLQYSYNLVPFKTIGEYANILGRGHASMNLLGNVLLLFPMGFYLPFFAEKMRKAKVFLPVVALLIIAIEGAQLLTFTGSFDVDDFLLNFLGAWLGYLVFVHTPIRAVFKLRAY